MIKKLVPLYVWFSVGYGFLALFISIVNFGMITLLTIKGMGIDAPASSLVILTVISIAGLSIIGFVFVRYNIQNEIAAYQNINMNPQIKQIYEDVKWIKESMKNHED
jgi:hypothetical protein